MDEQKTPEKPKRVIKLELKIDEKLAGGEYANICIVNHTDSEFVLDSFFLQPGRPQASMKARIILAPKNAKRLHAMLGDQLNRFEKRFGAINIGSAGPPVSVVH